MEEEQRLKALLSLEKVKQHGKADRWGVLWRNRLPPGI